MKLAALLTILLLLTGCTSPVKRTFPDVPKDLTVSCSDLQKIQEGAKLSEVVSTVSTNYGQYHDCRNKSIDWNTWYNTQKQIFESVK